MRLSVAKAVKVMLPTADTLRAVFYPVPPRGKKPETTELLYRDAQVRLCRTGPAVELRTRARQRQGVALPRRTVHRRMIGISYSIAAEVGEDRTTQLLYSDRQLKLYGVRLKQRIREYIMILLITKEKPRLD